MPRFRLIVLLLLAFAIGGCSTTRETEPPQTATEQLLMSTAVDKAVTKIRPNVPPGSKIYVDTADLDMNYATKYAVGSITASLLRQHYELVPTRNQADTVAEIHNGALSINKTTQLWLGIPSVTIPVPLAGPLDTPELDLIKSTKRRGIAKFGLNFYDADSGALQDAIGPIYGFSHYNHWVVLLVGWTSTDLAPEKGHRKSSNEQQ